MKKYIFLLERNNNGAFVLICTKDKNLVLGRYVFDTLKRPIHKNNTDINDFINKIKKARRIKIIIE